MGANAQTTVPTFSASQVLTADQQNQSARTGVPVFATTGTRDAAFGGSGEKTLAEGQLCYVEGTGFQTYNGTGWVTWGTAPAASGLVTVKAETAFSNVASVTADGVFTSSYTNYRMIVRYQVTSGLISMQLRAATVDAATNYNIQSLTAGSTTVAGARSTSQTSATIGNNSGGAFWSLAVVDITGPQLAEPTVYESHSVRNDGGYTTGLSIANYFGNHSDATAYDGIKLLGTAANITGSYTIYAYGKTV
jgi:hypothetical protein